jgi:hypothetical protein
MAPSLSPRFVAPLCDKLLGKVLRRVQLVQFELDLRRDEIGGRKSAHGGPQSREQSVGFLQLAFFGIYRCLQINCDHAVGSRFENCPQILLRRIEIAVHDLEIGAIGGVDRNRGRELLHRPADVAACRQNQTLCIDRIGILWIELQHLICLLPRRIQLPALNEHSCLAAERQRGFRVEPFGVGERGARSVGFTQREGGQSTIGAHHALHLRRAVAFGHILEQIGEIAHFKQSLGHQRREHLFAGATKTRVEQFGLRGVGIAELQIYLRQFHANGRIARSRLRRISQLYLRGAKIVFLLQFVRTLQIRSGIVRLR